MQTAATELRFCRHVRYPRRPAVGAPGPVSALSRSPPEHDRSSCNRHRTCARSSDPRIRDSSDSASVHILRGRRSWTNVDWRSISNITMFGGRKSGAEAGARRQLRVAALLRRWHRITTSAFPGETTVDQPSGDVVLFRRMFRSRSRKGRCISATLVGMPITASSTMAASCEKTATTGERPDQDHSTERPRAAARTQSDAFVRPRGMEVSATEVVAGDPRTVSVKASR